MPKKMTQKLEEYDPFSKYIGLTFTKWEKGYSQCVIEVNGNLLNPYKGLHGGVTYTMADAGMGFAVVSFLEEGERCATIETKIVYLKAVESGTITCDTQLIHKGKRVAMLESEIRQRGQLIAKAMGTWSIFKEKRG
ncbi:MAG: PaaI family thioesterase [Dehalococcoidia bacterium]|nr:MAG: PaaI family thioesterase [Dehalococcoidia bacterium]